MNGTYASVNGSGGDKAMGESTTVPSVNDSNVGSIRGEAGAAFKEANVGSG